jgi:AraC-like DNA-binding protein
MSRSTFANRFRSLVGAPPLEHLLRLRMHFSIGWLSSTGR